MGAAESLGSLRRIWFVFIFICRVAAIDDDQTGIPDTDLLCISDCAQCPVICSPPPSPPSMSKLPLPPPPPPPPCPTPVHHAPPQPNYYFHPPPPTLPEKSSPPPPRFIYVPSTQVPPDSGMGQHNPPSPYYYFYASNAAQFRFDLSKFFMLVTSFHVLVPFL